MVSLHDMQIEIETGIKIPPLGAAGGRLAGMNVGDSVRVNYSYRHRVSGMIHYHQKTRGLGQKFTRRTMVDDKGDKYIRVWRIK